VSITPELIAKTLEAQGVATDAARAEAHAALTATVLNTSVAAFSKLPFEQEPSGFIVELKRAAP
jgi:hypothetical protein